jgi:nitrate reductase beta subunit
MPDVYNWHLGRTMTYVYPEAHPDRQFAASSTSIAASAARPAPAPAKPPGPSHAGRSTCGGTMWRASPTAATPALGCEGFATAGRGAPGRGGAGAVGSQPNGRQRALWRLQWHDAYRAATDPNESGAGLSAPRERVAPPNFYEDTATKYKGGAYGLSTDGASLPEHQAWFFYLMRICNHCTYPACPPPARAKRSTSGKKTALCSLTRAAAAVTANAWSSAPTKSPCIAAPPTPAKNASAATRAWKATTR